MAHSCSLELQLLRPCLTWHDTSKRRLRGGCGYCLPTTSATKGALDCSCQALQPEPRTRGARIRTVSYPRQSLLSAPVLIELSQAWAAAVEYAEEAAGVPGGYQVVGEGAQGGEQEARELQPSAVDKGPVIAVPAELDASTFDVLELPDLGADTALLLGGTALFALLVGGIFLLFGKGYAGEVLPESALQAVTEQGAVLLVVRDSGEILESGSPQVKAARRGQVAYLAVKFLEKVGDDEFVEAEDFAERLLKKKGVDENSNFIVLDSSGKEAAVAAAKALTRAGVKKAQALKGGADAWKAAGLPWKEARLKLPDLGPVGVPLESLKEALSTLQDSVDNNKDTVPAVLGVLAAAGATAFVAAEAEAIVQLLGSVAVGQFLISKFLFAKDREETIAQLKSFVVKDASTAAPVVDVSAVVTDMPPKSQASPVSPAGNDRRKPSPGKETAKKTTEETQQVSQTAQTPPPKSVGTNP